MSVPEDAVREALNPDLIGFWKNEAHMPKEHFAVLHDAARLWVEVRTLNPEKVVLCKTCWRDLDDKETP